MKPLSGFVFVKAISFDGDGLSDTVLFEGKESVGLKDLSFKISNVAGSRENGTVDTIIVKSLGKPIGVISLDHSGEENHVFLSRVDMNADGQIDEKDASFLQNLLNNVILPEIESIESYFGIQVEEAK